MQASTLSPRQQQEVRAQVARFLAQNRAFHQLPAPKQAQVLADTEQIVAQMAAAGGNPDPYAGLARAQGDAIVGGGSIVGVNAGANVGTVVSGGAREMMQKSIGPEGSIIQVGVDQAARMIREIDFPTFVKSLITGVFKSIVQSSIDQMKAYAEMVRSVATSLNDFKDRNTTDNQARDHLVSRYPSLLQIAADADGPRVTLKDDADTDNLPDFQKDLGLSQPVTDLDDETIEQKLVPAARDDLARGRQQLLATIVLMGINRIVVTDGRINAKIRFQFSAKEKRNITASAYDYGIMGQQMTSSHTVHDGSSFDTGDSSAPLDTTGLTAEQKNALLQQQLSNQASASLVHYDDNSSVQPDVRVTSEVDMSSEGAIQASGQIMGEVSVNFKSDVFPLEKLVDTNQLQMLTAAQGAGRGAPPPPAPGATPAGTTAAPAATPAAPMPPPPPPPAATAPAAK